MDQNPLISIVVPVYKVESYLDECVESLIKQTYKKLEIILVDDGSPDHCPAMCDAWMARDSRIKVIHKRNGGLPDARNAGISVATGRWLLFIDSDDVVPDCFVEALAAAAQDENVLVVSGMTRFQHRVPFYTQTAVTPQPCQKALTPVRGGLYCCGALYSNAKVQSIDLRFDKTLRNIEDVAWNGIYLRYISKVVYVDVPYFYRMNPNSITSKCVDYVWQVASWIAARRSIMNWFAKKPLTDEQRKEVSGMFRHCQNNIHGECVAGNISYGQLHAMEKESSAQYDMAFVPLPERWMIHHCPKLYHGIYTWLLRIKKAIRK